MILAGQLWLGDRLAEGFVRTNGDIVEEVVEGELPQKFDAGGPGCLISPGFIDTHLHLPQFDMIGAHGMPLLTWLEEVTFPAERKWRDPDYARVMTERVVGQCIAHGTTGICAFSSVHHEATLAALEVAAQTGLRGVIGQSLMDRNVPDDMRFNTQRMIDELGASLDRFPPGRRTSAAVTPRFAISCSDQLMTAAARMASESGAVVQTHLAETVRECEWVGEIFDCSYVDAYDRVGLVGERSIFGHGIYLSESELTTLAQRGAKIAHCPTANSFLRSGQMNRWKTIGSGTKVALGSDIGAGYERSMVRVARAMIETAAAIGDDYPTPSDAWTQITSGNADLMGWQDVGRIAPGASADLLVINPDIPWREGSVDPLSNLLFAWDDRWLTQTVLRGKIVYRRLAH